MTINKSLTIVGPGARNLIVRRDDGTNPTNFSIFRIAPNFGPAVQVTMRGLTISNGSTFNGTGGIACDQGTLLTLNGVAVTGNTGFVGGISNDGTTTLINTLVANNIGQIGGIVNNQGTVTVANSTISDNQGSGNGYAGGIYNAATLNLNNVTIANNSETSGDISSAGGLKNTGTVNVRNTLIAGNSSSANNTYANVWESVFSTVTSQGNNLVFSVPPITGFGNAGSNDIIGQLARLGDLGNYGGQTNTRLLLSTAPAISPAIDAGNNCVVTATCSVNNPPVPLTTDQRGIGFARKSGTAVDIGAFEVQRKTPFDFDGDGKADVAVARNNGGNLTWYLLNSQTGFTAVTFGISTDRIVPADYDGDGKTDIAVFRSGTWYIQQSTLGFTGIAFGASDDVPVPADYDGDGKADVAVFRPSTGVWYLQRSTLGFTGISFGQAGDKPVAADYDGDGKTDVAVNRNGTWYIQRSTLGFTGIAFGDSNDKLVPADYDGDGVADIAVFRPSNGAWYLQRSQLGFTGIAFGSSTDLAVPADYDGEGKTDVAVTRANGSALTWYLLRSQDGFTGVGFGTSTDKAVENAYIP